MALWESHNCHAWKETCERVNEWVTAETPLSVPNLWHLATNSRTSALMGNVGFGSTKVLFYQNPFKFYHSVFLLYGSLLHHDTTPHPPLSFPWHGLTTHSCETPSVAETQTRNVKDNSALGEDRSPDGDRMKLVLSLRPLSYDLPQPHTLVSQTSACLSSRKRSKWDTLLPLTAGQANSGHSNALQPKWRQTCWQDLRRGFGSWGPEPPQALVTGLSRDGKLFFGEKRWPTWERPLIRSTSYLDPNRVWVPFATSNQDYEQHSHTSSVTYGGKHSLLTVENRGWRKPSRRRLLLFTDGVVSYSLSLSLSHTHRAHTHTHTHSLSLSLTHTHTHTRTHTHTHTHSLSLSLSLPPSLSLACSHNLSLCLSLTHTHTHTHTHTPVSVLYPKERSAVFQWEFSLSLSPP